MICFNLLKTNFEEGHQGQDQFCDPLIVQLSPYRNGQTIPSL